MGENVSLCWNFAEGTSATAQGTLAIAVGDVSYYEAYQTSPFILKVYGKLLKGHKRPGPWQIWVWPCSLATVDLIY